MAIGRLTGSVDRPRPDEGAGAVRHADTEAAARVEAPRGRDPGVVEARRAGRVPPAGEVAEGRRTAPDVPRSTGPRLVADRLGTLGERLGRLQTAQRTLAAAREDLGRLGELAARAEATTAAADRRALAEEAGAIAGRLARADEDRALAEVRRARREEVERRGDEVEAPEPPAREAVPRPTLTLRPRPEPPAEAARRQAERIAAETPRAEAPPPTGRPSTDGSLRPRVVDLESAEGARETRAAVAEATDRLTALEERVRLLTSETTEQARRLARAPQASEPGEAEPVRSERQARETADRIARSTVDDPARALAAQPFLTIEAALRVL